MGMFISDGNGRGYTAGVSNDNQLMTLSTTESVEHYMNVMKGEAYSLIVTQTPSTSGNCIVYLKNNSDKDIIIEQMELFTDGDQILDVKLGVEGTPANGISTTPANNNTRSAKSADGTFLVGNDITGLSSGVVVSRVKVKGNEQSRVWNFPCDLVIGKNRTLAIYCENTSVETNINLSFFFDYDGVSC